MMIPSEITLTVIVVILAILLFKNVQLSGRVSMLEGMIQAILLGQIEVIEDEIHKETEED